MNIFDQFIVYPIINVLLLIYHALLFVNLPYALGFSIIVLTIIIRLILYPLTGSQIKASKKMQELNPHLANLKEKHKNDAKTLQAETMKLYKEHGVNPLAGCLPVLVQLPVIWGLYSVLNKIIHIGAGNLVEINKIAYVDFLKLSKTWDPTFFGIPLAQNPSHLISTIGPLILLVPILTGAFQFIQSKMLIPSAPKNALVKKNQEKKDDFATAFQSQSLYIFPAMIGFFSYSFPIGLSLYWNTFTIFGIIQQYKISGLGGLKDWIEKYGKK
ncbi:MAG TPA: YidC/Oxa1 family membrane protein insertase [Candidatus Sulfotelmatobacter sp.]|nr:YidC/Oxa1 family membrane protein insertase [Candidatus Sulfotelmatobacter sp.]